MGVSNRQYKRKESFVASLYKESLVGSAHNGELPNPRYEGMNLNANNDYVEFGVILMHIYERHLHIYYHTFKNTSSSIISTLTSIAPFTVSQSSFITTHFFIFHGVVNMIFQLVSINRPLISCGQNNHPTLSHATFIETKVKKEIPFQKGKIARNLAQNKFAPIKR